MKDFGIPTSRCFEAAAVEAAAPIMAEPMKASNTCGGRNGMGGFMIRVVFLQRVPYKVSIRDTCIGALILRTCLCGISYYSYSKES